MFGRFRVGFSSSLKSSVFESLRRRHFSNMFRSADKVWWKQNVLPIFQVNFGVTCLCYGRTSLDVSGLWNSVINAEKLKFNNTPTFCFSLTTSSTWIVHLHKRFVLHFVQVQTSTYKLSESYWYSQVFLTLNPTVCRLQYK